MARDAVVVDSAKKQLGLITRRQAIGAGLSAGAVEGRIQHGDWEVVGRGVYRLQGSSPSWEQRAMALCLQCEPSAVLSHRSAAWVFGLEGIGKAEPDPIDIMLPRGHGLDVEATVRLTRKPEREVYRGLPVTPVTRTLLDLAPLLSEENLELALDSALRLAPRAKSEIEKRLEATRGCAFPGRKRLSLALSERDGTVDSALETLVQRALWAAGLPKPKLHFNVRHRGKWIANVDFAWPDQKLVVQAHGLKFHLNPQRYRIDQRQQSELAAAGWLQVTTTWKEVNRHTARFIECVKAAWVEASRRSA